MKSILSFLLFCATLAHGVDWAPPAVNQGQWAAGTNVGITGGIDQYRAGGAFARGAEGGGTTITVTSAPYNADNTGATDATTAIRTAIVDASPGDLVYIPAGTYRLNSPLAIYHEDDGVTVRGAGPGVTILDCRSSTGVGIGAGDAFDSNVQTVTGTGGSTGSWPKGATVLNVASTTGYVAEYLANIFIANEEDTARIQAGATLAFSITGYENVRTHTVRIMSVAAGAITIDPPLPVDCANYAVVIKTQQNAHHVLSLAGLEDLTVSGANASVAAGVNINWADQCWVYNVATDNIINYPCKNYYNYRSEIRYNTFAGGATGGSNGAGILWNRCSSGLIVDNIILRSFPFTEENEGSMNNVWAYNFTVGASPGTVMNVNHNAHNLLNLYEGNVTQGYQNDGYYGGASHLTFYRNWLHAQFEGSQRNAVSQNRFSRNTVQAANVMGWDGISIPADSYGNPNLGNGSTTGTARPSTGDFWADWKMTGTVQAGGLTATQATITVNNPGQLYVDQGGIYFGSAQFNGPSIYWNGRTNYRRLTAVIAISGNDVTFGDGPFDSGDNFPAAGTAVTIFTGSAGFQEADLDAELTTTKTHNYMSSLTTGAVVNSTADTLPNSLTYSARPAWFTVGLTWPPINPNAPNFTMATTIPAAARYFEGAVDSTAPVLTGATIGSSGTTIAFSFTEAVTPGAGGSTGWALSLSTGSATATYSSGSGTNSLIYNLSSTVNNGTTGTVAYTQPTNGLEDGTGNDLVTLSGFAITNNSIQGIPGPTITTGTLSIGGALSIGN